MPEPEEKAFITLAERIAALNSQRNFKAPLAGKRAPPAPPPPYMANHSIHATSDISSTTSTDTHSPSLPRTRNSGVASNGENGPALPRRTSTIPPTIEPNEKSPPLPIRRLAPPPSSRASTQQPTSPALPPRRPSHQAPHGRRASNASDISLISNVSNLTLSHTVPEQLARRLQPTLVQAKLPPLPSNRRAVEATAKQAVHQENARLRLKSTRSEFAVSRIVDPPPRPPARFGGTEWASPGLVSEVRSRRLPPSPSQITSRTKSALEMGFASGQSESDTAPPLVPLNSRPTSKQIDTLAGMHPASTAPPVTCCLVCRDFTGPDAVALEYPVHILPRHDPVGYLARVLCVTFPSATDKARAIFTWCHHNIAYDVEGFFGACIPRGQTPAESIFTGRAVCEGYARIYEAIALRAGLECEVVVGHGKGYGFVPLAPGQGLPRRDPSGHAWNAVRIDGGEWKLLDACWGAGAVGDQRYTKRFAPEMFYLPNEIFGLKHFPSQTRHFYRGDGCNPTWEEYIAGPLKGPQAIWYSSATEEGLNELTLSPRDEKIPVFSGDSVRFQCSKICEHWDHERNGRGKPYLLMMKVHGLDGRKEDLVPLDHDGFWWHVVSQLLTLSSGRLREIFHRYASIEQFPRQLLYLHSTSGRAITDTINARWVDIAARDLGAPGQTISLYGLATLDGQDARGISKEHFLVRKGRCGMSWVGIAAWELV